MDFIAFSRGSCILFFPATRSGNEILLEVPKTATNYERRLPQYTVPLSWKKASRDYGIDLLTTAKTLSTNYKQRMNDIYSQYNCELIKCYPCGKPWPGMDVSTGMTNSACLSYYLLLSPSSIWVIIFHFTIFYASGAGWFSTGIMTVLESMMPPSPGPSTGIIGIILWLALRLWQYWNP